LVALQKQCDCGRKNTSEEDVEEDGDDTEEDIAIVHPDVGNEVCAILFYLIDLLVFNLEKYLYRIMVRNLRISRLY